MIYCIRESEHVPLTVSHYYTYHTSIVATGKEGGAPGELNHASGIAIHEDTHQIFVANRLNNRIEIFSETGEYLYQLGVGQLSGPHGIAIHGDSLYVSCWDHTVSKFSLTEMCCVRRIGNRGSNNEESIFPSQLTTDHIGRVFIPDCHNDRICIHDPDLNHLRNITHQFLSGPYNVKISLDLMYVLCPYHIPCMHVLTLEGDKIRSLIACSERMDKFDPLFFCLDPLNNIIVGDQDNHLIHVFSPEGKLLHTIGREGHQQGMFYEPTGVVITPNGRLVCVSWNENYGMQIF